MKDKLLINVVEIISPNFFLLIQLKDTVYNKIKNIREIIHIAHSYIIICLNIFLASFIQFFVSKSSDIKNKHKNIVYINILLSNDLQTTLA
jgi:hypothetical protein